MAHAPETTAAVAATGKRARTAATSRIADALAPSHPNRRSREICIHQTVTTPFQDRFSFEIDPFRKHCLAEGLDEVGLTMARGAAIADYEAKVRAARPFLAHGTEIDA